MFRRILIRALMVIAVAFVVIQFVPVDRANPPVVADIAAPPHVDAVLRRSCYDCHSNETHWPWYSRVAPASWLVAKDVREGRESLNFSEWRASQDEALSEIMETVDEGEMPMNIYVLMHPGAALNNDDIAALRQWTSSLGMRSGEHDSD